MTTISHQLLPMTNRDELDSLRSDLREHAPYSLIVSVLIFGIILASTTLYLAGMSAGAAIILR